MPSGTHLSLCLPPARAGDPGQGEQRGEQRGRVGLRDLHPQPPHPWSGSGSRTGSSQVSDAMPGFTGTPELAGDRRVLGELRQSCPFPARRCPGLFTGRFRSLPGSGFTERLLAVWTQRRPSLGTLPSSSPLWRGASFSLLLGAEPEPEAHRGRGWPPEQGLGRAGPGGSGCRGGRRGHVWKVGAASW